MRDLGGVHMGISYFWANGHMMFEKKKKKILRKSNYKP
jgi:hypothetical protein